MLHRDAFPRFLALGCMLGVVSFSTAQLKITNQSYFNINFDESIGYDDGIADNDVMKGPIRLDNLKISEPDHWDYSPANATETVLSSAAWAYKSQTIDDSFDDYNNNGRLDDRREVLQVRGIDKNTMPYLGDDNRALQFDGETSEDKWLTLRVKNATGSSVLSWGIGLVAYYYDAGANGGAVWVSAGSSLTSMTPVIGLDSPNSNLGWGGDILFGTADVTVADGEYLYVQFHYDQNGRGNTMVIDNIGIQGVVPEPATLTLLGAGLALIARRRR